MATGNWPTWECPNGHRFAYPLGSEHAYPKWCPGCGTSTMHRDGFALVEPDPSAAVSGTGGSPNPEPARPKELRWAISRTTSHDMIDGPYIQRIDVVPEQLLVESRAREEKLREALEEIKAHAESCTCDAELCRRNWIPMAIDEALADGPSPSVPVEDSER